MEAVALATTLHVLVVGRSMKHGGQLLQGTTVDSTNLGAHWTLSVVANLFSDSDFQFQHA